MEKTPRIAEAGPASPSAETLMMESQRLRGESEKLIELAQRLRQEIRRRLGENSREK